MRLAQVIGAIGTPQFEQVLLDVLHELADAEHLSAFVFQADLVPTVATAASLDGGDLGRRAGEAYIRQSLYLGDPMRHALRPRILEGSCPALHIITDAPGTRHQARQDFYDRFGLGERVTILGHARLGWMSLNLYRPQDKGSLTGDALDALERAAPVYHASAARHLELNASSPRSGDADRLIEERLSRIGTCLTPRETDVCLAALRGRTNVEIGVALGIGTSTVGTLRRRAYERLNVSNIADLFLLCLNAKA